MIYSRYSDHCVNTIVETSNILKDEIQVLWVAPPVGGGCVLFQATVLGEGYIILLCTEVTMYSIL